jgi:hypothetical protein
MEDDDLLRTARISMEHDTNIATSILTAMLVERLEGLLMINKALQASNHELRSQK